MERSSARAYRECLNPVSAARPFSSKQEHAFLRRACVHRPRQECSRMIKDAHRVLCAVGPQSRFCPEL